MTNQKILNKNNLTSKNNDNPHANPNVGKIACGKVVCVGRNYAAHAKELGNDVPTRPILFIKPASSIIALNETIPSLIKDVPRNKSYDVHYEAELCLRLGEDLKSASVAEIEKLPNLIDAVTVGLDLTLRELQTELKQKGHPWERAKCFDGSCVLGEWVDAGFCDDFSDVNYRLFINDILKQDGNTAMMLFPVYELLSEISHAFSLQAGDVIMTGTPSGVGVLKSQDEILLKLGDYQWQANVT